MCERRYEGLVLATAIKIVKRDTGLRDADIARLVGVGKSTIHRYVRGLGGWSAMLELSFERLAEARRDFSATRSTREKRGFES